MSLATRCTSCGTIFKVVQDQLKVSEGWVRCGRCHEVFNALEGLFDLERDPPPQRPAAALQRTTIEPPREAPSADAGTPQDTADSALPPSASAAPAAPAAAEPEPPKPEAGGWIPTEPAALGEVPSTHEDDALESRWLIRPARDGLSATQRATRGERKHDFSDAEFPVDVDLGDDLDESFFGSVEAQDAAAEPVPAAPETLESARAARPTPGAARASRSSRRHRSSGAGAKPKTSSMPGFVRQAERQARWRSPAMRALLSVVALALTGMLLIQTALRYRNEIHAAYPQTRGVGPGTAPLAGTV